MAVTEQNGLAEMEAAISRLRKEIQQLKEERDALEQGNLELYKQLTTPDFCTSLKIPHDYDGEKCTIFLGIFA